MTIHNWQENGRDFFEKPLKLAIGGFDSIHRGHQTVLKDVDGVIFFEPLAATIFDQEFKGVIATVDQRLKIFESLGLKVAITIDFSIEISKITGSNFFNSLLYRWPIASLSCGADFRIGANRLWGVKEIATWAASKNIAFKSYPLIKINDEVISSNLLRESVAKGAMHKACLLMGRNFCLDLSGIEAKLTKNKVIYYSLAESKQVIPADGVYLTDAGLIEIKQKKLYCKTHLKEIQLLEKWKKE